MKRGFRILLFLMAAITVATGISFAADDPITLKLDGNVIQTEVPPIIVSGRTMAPAKFLFEAMGGTVDWLESTRQVKVALNDTTVMLTIDSKTAQVNGKNITMDVPPMIKERRTLIPTSFVAQQLGCTVNWINDTRTVEIISPTPPEPVENAKITAINTERLSDGIYRIVITADMDISKYKGYTYDSPDRYVLDIEAAELDMDLDEGEEGSLTTGNDLFSTVRYSQFEESKVRIVADLNEKASGNVTVSDDKTTVYVVLQEASSNSSGNGNSSNGSNGTPADITGMGIPQLDSRLSDKLVVIDPGHGGTDPGSQGKDSSGKVIQNEKDLNLDIALRLNELLMGAGVKTYMLRSDDSSMALYDRPAKANELNADLYVSVHNNSNDSPTPNGTETHYYNKSAEAGFSYTSKQIADAVQAELTPLMGLKDRGVKSSPSLAVLNKSKMPAIIIEGGFISNPTELSFMMTDKFKEAYALGAARGIVKALNASLNAN